MTVIDRAHRLVLIAVAATIPTAFLVDFSIEAISGGSLSLPGWHIYAAVAVIAAWQIAKKLWNADWVIVGTGLLTAVLGVLSHHGTQTIIDLHAGTVIVAATCLVSVAISRRAPVVAGSVLGIATVYMVALGTINEGLETDDVITKCVIVAILFGCGSWLLYQLRRGYEEQYVARDRLIATVSHELRTPLTSLVGFSDALSNNTVDPGSPEAADIIDIIAGQAQEAADIVEDLLVAFRTAPGELTLEISETDLAQEAQTVASAFLAGHASASKGLSLDTASVMVLADPLRLRQIIRNLITNAYRHGGDQVQVRTSHSKESGIIEVVDNGPGFDPDEAETLFQPYGRSRHTKSGTGSIGLGLTVARHLARLMGGDLTARREGDTTVFELALPRA